jgi:hypothetical protein
MTGRRSHFGSMHRQVLLLALNLMLLRLEQQRRRVAAPAHAD